MLDKNYLPRTLEANITKILESGKSILLLGPRQTGKTTLMNQIVVDKRINLANPKDRLRYEKNPEVLTNEIEALAETQSSDKPVVVTIDEIQKIPILMDVVQDLIDRKLSIFILTGSRARQLKKRNNINLLPGRVIPLRLDPLTYLEQKSLNRELYNYLIYGDLPEVVLLKNIEEKETLLDAYTTVYLEEEIRSEAVVRNLGSFARFLELAAAESGKIINFSKLSQEIGVSQSTIISYYQILEDCLIIERIDPIIISNTRKKLSKAQKYIFYDLGVRRLAAREGTAPARDHMGHLFEQYVGLELIRSIRLRALKAKLRYWRDPSGPEVDWVIEKNNSYIPIEVKLTADPKKSDFKHLQIFLEEYNQHPAKGFIICQTPNIIKISSNIYALPWNSIDFIFKQDLLPIP